MWLPGRLPESLPRAKLLRAFSAHLRGECAGRWDEGFILRHRLEKLVVFVLDLEQELAQERLMVGLAQCLVALRKVVTLLHFHAFERLDELWRIGAAIELRGDHGLLQGVQ